MSLDPNIQDPDEKEDSLDLFEILSVEQKSNSVYSEIVRRKKNRLSDFMVRPRYIYAISRFVPMNPVIDCTAK